MAFEYIEHRLLKRADASSGIISMSRTRIIALAILLTLTLASPAPAQSEQGGAGGDRTQELVDQLKEVIRDAEQNRRSNPRTTKQLRELVQRYDYPWRISLLEDDFRDGDYTYDPRWVVRQGEFWVAQGAGLRSSFDPAEARTPSRSDRKSDNPALDILGEILLGGRERSEGATPASQQSEAEIFTRVGITNAFAAKLQLNLKNSPERDARLEFGPFRGEGRSSGYRLAYESGRKPTLSLLRFSPNRSAVIERVNQGIALEDGRPHTLEWRRASDGEMVVLLDDKPVLRTVDRSHAEPFDGFAVVNKGGEFEMTHISIFGTKR